MRFRVVEEPAGVGAARRTPSSSAVSPHISADSSPSLIPVLSATRQSIRYTPGSSTAKSRGSSLFSKYALSLLRPRPLTPGDRPDRVAGREVRGDRGLEARAQHAQVFRPGAVAQRPAAGADAGEQLFDALGPILRTWRGPNARLAYTTVDR